MSKQKEGKQKSDKKIAAKSPKEKKAYKALKKLQNNNSDRVFI
jgi:hypothetical protein